MTARRLEYVGFVAPVQEPPGGCRPSDGRTGKERTSLWDYGDQPGGDGNELHSIAAYLTEEEVLLVHKVSGIRNRVPLRNVSWYREMGERERAANVKDELRIEMAPRPEAEPAPTQAMPAPNPEFVPTPAKKAPTPAAKATG